MKQKNIMMLTLASLGLLALTVSYGLAHNEQNYSTFSHMGSGVLGWMGSMMRYDHIYDNMGYIIIKVRNIFISSFYALLTIHHTGCF